MNKKTITSVVYTAVVCALLAAGCGSDGTDDKKNATNTSSNSENNSTPDPNNNSNSNSNSNVTPNPELPQGAVLRSALSRDEEPSVDRQDLRSVVDGNNAFALSLYATLAKGAEGGNLFYSPFSISQALVMTYAGARDTTAQQMAATMHFVADEALLHSAFNEIDLQLSSRGQGAQGKDGKGFRLNVVNSIWAQRGYPIMQDFLDVLGLNYGAAVYALNFKDEPEPSRKIINKWVSDKTETRIDELLKQGDILPSTRLVLTNAIYFNAAWKEEYIFPEESTSDQSFTLLDGSTVTAPTMAHMMTYNNASNAADGWRAVELPYDGDELSMLVIVPDQGRFAEVEGKLGNTLLDDVVSKLQPSTLSLTLPKWEQRSHFRLKEQLSALGMKEPFTPSANFTGINGGVEDLWISNVIHEAFVTVDEKGTEAAAATAVVMIGGGPMQPDELNIDRPFIFLIRDIPTNSILFVGRVLNPTK